jgi:hemoglobin
MRIAVALAVSLALFACGGSKQPAAEAPAPATTDNRSLYERLGGTPAITAVVEEFVATTGSDPRISAFFVNADVPRLKQMMVDHICSITGGTCTYGGKSMKESHTGMHVKPEHFAAFMDDLAKTLDKLNVPAREKGEVLAAFESMQPDVIEP